MDGVGETWASAGIPCLRVEFLLKTDSGYPKDTGVSFLGDGDRGLLGKELVKFFCSHHLPTPFTRAREFLVSFFGEGDQRRPRRPRQVMSADKFTVTKTAEWATLHLSTLINGQTMIQSLNSIIDLHSSMGNPSLV